MVIPFIQIKFKIAKVVVVPGLLRAPFVMFSEKQIPIPLP